MRTYRSSLLLGALLTCAAPFANPLSAQAAPEGRWLVRVRALSLTANNGSDAIPSLRVPTDAITVSDKLFPEFDISYFLTKHVAAELVLTYPQQHDVKLSGTKIGTFKHLPPTLLAQYHFLPEGTVRPYAGVGVNLTLISDVKLAVPGVGKLDLESSSIGMAGQLGADIKVAPRMFLNVDVKKVMISSDVTLGAATVSAVRVHPWLASVGLGFRL
jgi:outer membrane protein